MGVSNNNPQPEWDQIPIKPDTKAALALFKEVSGMGSFDEAVAYMLGLVIKPEDNGDLAQAALRVRMARTKQIPKFEGRTVLYGTPSPGD